MEIIEVFTDMVNCSLFPEAYEQLSRERRKNLRDWVPFEDGLAETAGAWLPQIVREIRYNARPRTRVCIYRRLMYLLPYLWAFNNFTFKHN